MSWCGYLLGRELYGRRCGLLAALLAPDAVPRHREPTGPPGRPTGVLRDDDVWALARYANVGRARWLYFAASFLGLSVLSKESSIILAGSVYAFFALARTSARVALAAPASDRSSSWSASDLGLPTALLAGATRTGGTSSPASCSVAPTTVMFYPPVVPTAIGVGVVTAAAVAFLLSWRAFQLARDAASGRGSSSRSASSSCSPSRATSTCCRSPRPSPCSRRASCALLRSAPTVRTGSGRARRLATGRHDAGRCRVAVARRARLVSRSGRRRRHLPGRNSGGVPGGREPGTWIRGHVPVGAR